jgi:DNA-binding GntR family transcriptional regulator
MGPIERPETLTEAVARHVRDAIVRGDYAPGSALPEIRLAAELGTSRGTVREALRGLEDLGLVEVLPHRGSFVSQMSKARARDLYDMRVVLEAYAVRIAVEDGAFDGNGRLALTERLEALEAAAEGDEPMEMIETERALHREIWSRCRNRLLLEELATLQLQTRRLLIYNKAFNAPHGEELAMHRDLVDAILSGDPDTAESAMRAHIRLSAGLVLAKMPEDIPGEG